MSTNNGALEPGPPTPELDTLLLSIRVVAFDFDGVFTDNAVWVTQDGVELVRCWRSDGLGLRELDRCGITAVIVSTESNPVVTARAQKLKLRAVQNCADKHASLKELAAEYGVGLENICFVGNDINDASCLEAVGLPILVADAHPDVLGLARCRTTVPGGYGAVREICGWFRDAYARRANSHGA